MSQFLGFISLDATLGFTAVVRDGNESPVNADSAPPYRVYGPSGLMANGTGTLTQKETGTVTAASNASPIVITSAGHGLTTGTRVTVSGVGGNTAANTTTTITKLTADTFSLDGTTGNGAYTTGGSWNTSGLYGGSVVASAANGYVSGQTYTILVSPEVSSTVRASTYTFTVN